MLAKNASQVFKIKNKWSHIVIRFMLWVWWPIISESGFQPFLKKTSIFMEHAGDHMNLCLAL